MTNFSVIYYKCVEAEKLVYCDAIFIIKTCHSSDNNAEQVNKILSTIKPEMWPGI